MDCCTPYKELTANRSSTAALKGSPKLLVIDRTLVVNSMSASTGLGTLLQHVLQVKLARQEIKCTYVQQCWAKCEDATVMLGLLREVQQHSTSV